jgi:hypothetical protein
VAISSNVTIANRVLAANTASEGPEISLRGGENPSTLTISHTDVDGGQPDIDVHPDCTLNWGDGNIDADPIFVDPDGPDNDTSTFDDNNYHLHWHSPCIDAGDNSAIPPDNADLDGDGNTTEPIPFDLDGWRRIANLVVDMGAYAVQRIITPGLHQPAGPVRSRDAQPAPQP